MNANPWFRMYSEFATDPKVQSMSEIMQRRLVMLFCLRCSDVLVTLCDDDIAFALRVTEQELADTKSLFLRKGFIDERWNLINWGKRQFVSDSSTKRTREYRERIRTSQGSHSDGREQKCDALDTDTDTDTDKKNTPPQKPAAKKISSADRFEEFWQLYPQKSSGPTAARKSWAKKATSDKAAEEIISGLKEHLPALMQKESEFRPHATTWLNQERWKAPVSGLNGKGNPNGIQSNQPHPAMLASNLFKWEQK